MSRPEAVEQLIEAVQPIIAYHVRRCSWPGHYLLSPEELKAEAHVALAKVLNLVSDPTDHDNVIPLFVRIMSDHFVDLRRLAGRRKRATDWNSVPIDSDDVDIWLHEPLNRVGEDAFYQMYARERLAQAREMLSPEAFRVLSALYGLEPKVFAAAEADYQAALRLQKVGTRTYLPSGRITTRVMALGLGMPRWRLKNALGEIGAFFGVEPVFV